VLETLQSDTREDLQVVLQEYGKATNSEGGDGYRRSIKYQAPAFRDSAIVNDATLGILEHDLSNYLKGAARFAEGLDRNPQQLKNLVTDFAKTADAFAVEQANLSRTISQLPGTLQTGNRALGELNRAFPPCAASSPTCAPPSAPRARTSTPRCRSSSRCAASSASPSCAAWSPTSSRSCPNLVELNRGGIALQEEQRLLSSCQNNVVNPWQNDTIRPELPLQRARLPGRHQVAAGHRRREPLVRRQRPVRAVAGQDRELRLPGRRRALLPDRPAAAGRQPAEGQAAAAAPRRAVRDADAARPAHRGPGGAGGFKVDQNAPGAASAASRHARSPWSGWASSSRTPASTAR
jgi:hypothetical protein